MNPWLVAAALMLTALIPCALVALRGPPMQRLIGLEAASVVTTLGLLALAQGFDRDVYFDLSLVFAVMSVIGNLAYIRFYERWI
jgi:multisubunit Na+/H+ antiporter MnhF subunit